MASTVSKLLPSVLTTAVPFVGGCQANHSDAPPVTPQCIGSSGSLVAPAVLKICVPLKPWAVPPDLAVEVPLVDLAVVSKALASDILSNAADERSTVSSVLLIWTSVGMDSRVIPSSVARN